MRVYALYIFITVLSLYAYRDWFKSLCGLILLMAVVQHAEFPNSIAGIQGLNPWNVALANVVVGWLVGRRREGLTWDLPRHIGFLLIAYIVIIMFGLLRAAVDPVRGDASFMSDLISERFINTLKWPIPALMLYDGCRTRKRFVLALASTLGVYVLLAAQVIRWMPPGAVADVGSMMRRSHKIILNEIGYHPINISMMLAGACWATFATIPLVRKNWQKLALVVVAIAVAYAQALTGGRMGYVTWGFVGLALGVLRWRRYLLLGPLIVVGVAFAAPAAVDRMLQGFGQTSADGDVVVNQYDVTSGRTLIWPYVGDKFLESPIIGHGRLAMKRTGLADQLLRDLGESFPHPHNAYLEWLLDNGLVGFLPVIAFYLLILFRSASMFMSKSAEHYVAIGGVCFSLVLALLVASMGSQSFYPREGSVCMWAAIALMLRLYVTREEIARRDAPVSTGLIERAHALPRVSVP